MKMCYAFHKNKTFATNIVLGDFVRVNGAGKVKSMSQAFIGVSSSKIIA